jgi:hypothetical protein
MLFWKFNFFLYLYHGIRHTSRGEKLNKQVGTKRAYIRGTKVFY